ncbi:M48 family metallopeptidase [uncultured Azohydromonas sp.]|uniref:M48 family metallopeptidase n=1 Tax=uncultured Azohydromonas sp. TaxID=487342 RepID=UPI00261FA724|nr:M48 family metallopeptidase [uncultured Azohydromonas sp.]
MDADRFKQLVARLERESAAAPGRYRAKVAALTALGFGILALLFATVGFGLLVLVGLAMGLAFSGGAALLLLVKLGKLLLLLAFPLWFFVHAGVRALFVRLPRPEGREITRAEAPALFEALDGMRRRLKGPRVHHVLVVDGVNAAVVQRPALGMIGWPRNHLLLGLPLLEGLSPAEALAVVGHEYGHLAGSHGQFSAFIYRQRHTWSTVEQFTERLQGRLGRMAAPLVRWYAPYFNAYTFVLARADEYQADAAAATLVGPAHVAHALKRVKLLTSSHQRFMQQAFDRMDHDAAPPADLLQRWAAQAGEAPVPADARRCLDDALDSEGHFTDSHPTLRARLSALQCDAATLQEPPPPLLGDSAARAWLGPLAEALRRELQARWAEEVMPAWAERHAHARQLRQRLRELRALDARDAAQQIELLHLSLRLEPEADVREALSAFNAAHADHPLGLYLEGTARLNHGEHEGLALLDRAIALDPEATKLVCERAHAFLAERREREAAEAWARRWRERHALERLREQQLRTLDAAHPLAPHGLEEERLAAVRTLLDAKAREDITEAWLARRVIPADATVLQLVLGVRLSWWARRRGRQREIVKRLAALDWPVPLVVVTLDGRYAGMRKKLMQLGQARVG